MFWIPSTLAEKRSDGDFEPRRSIFDIVYQTTSNGTARRPIPLAPRNPR